MTRIRKGTFTDFLYPFTQYYIAKVGHIQCHIVIRIKLFAPVEGTCRHPVIFSLGFFKVDCREFSIEGGAPHRIEIGIVYRSFHYK